MALPIRGRFQGNIRLTGKSRRFYGGIFIYHQVVLVFLNGYGLPLTGKLLFKFVFLSFFNPFRYHHHPHNHSNGQYKECGDKPAPVLGSYNTQQKIQLTLPP
jgi:hypothetical protein